MKNDFWKFSAKFLGMAFAGIFLSTFSVAAVSYAAYKIFDLVELRLTLRRFYSVFNLVIINSYISYLVLLAIVLLALLLGYLFARRTTARMNNIMNAVQQIQKGEYYVLLPNDNRDDLGSLEQSINQLGIEINNTLNRRKEIEQSKDDFIVNIAHDLRTPLTSIIGYLSLLSEKQLGPELSAKYAGVALEKSGQLEQLIDSLFDIAQFTMDAIPISKEELSLERLLMQKRDELYPQLHAADMEIQLMLPDPAPKIHADGTLMARVFDNLINNAIRYAKDGHYIDIEAEASDGKLRISIVTHANPIPADELEKVFDKLYRLEKSRAAGTGGAGLGLSISRRIVELHGGTLTARQAGNGTAFDIYLPHQCCAHEITGL